MFVDLGHELAEHDDEPVDGDSHLGLLAAVRIHGEVVVHQGSTGLVGAWRERDLDGGQVEVLVLELVEGEAVLEAGEAGRHRLHGGGVHGVHGGFLCTVDELLESFNLGPGQYCLLLAGLMKTLV